MALNNEQFIKNAEHIDFFTIPKGTYRLRQTSPGTPGGTYGCQLLTYLAIGPLCITLYGGYGSYAVNSDSTMNYQDKTSPTYLGSLSTELFIPALDINLENLPWQPGNKYISVDYDRILSKEFEYLDPLIKHTTAYKYSASTWYDITNPTIPGISKTMNYAMYLSSYMDALSAYNGAPKDQQTIVGNLKTCVEYAAGIQHVLNTKAPDFKIRVSSTNNNYVLRTSRSYITTVNIDLTIEVLEDYNLYIANGKGIVSSMYNTISNMVGSITNYNSFYTTGVNNYNITKDILTDSRFI